MTLAILKSPTRVILALCAFGIIAAVSTFLFILLPMREEDQVKTSESIKASQKAVTESLETHFSDLENYLETKARSPEMVLAASQPSSSDILTKLEMLATTNSDIEACFMTDLRGTTIALFPDDPNVTGKNFAFRDWYQQVSLVDRTIISEVYHTAVFPHPQVLGISTPIKAQDKKTLAYLTILVKATTITGWIKSSLAKKEFGISIFDQSGNLISLNHNSSKLIQNFTTNQALKLAQNRNSEVFEAIDPVSGSKSLVGHSPVTKLKGQVIVSQPIAEVFTRYYSGLKSLGIVSFTFFIFLFLLSSFLMSAKKNKRV
jgi:hypothetical protein